MRVFVTGATGFLASAVVPVLLGAGHSVLGLARSDSSAQALAAAGAEAHRGDLEDLDSLRSGAAASDAAIHLGFGEDFSRFQENSQIDKRAIEALGAALAGSDKPLLVPNGLIGLTPPGQVATEHDNIPEDYKFPRVSEQTALGLVPQGVHAVVVRLPQVHNTTKQGLVTGLTGVARKNGVSAFVGDGANRWSAAHVSDVARLFLLVLENGEAGAKYHAVAEEGVPLREIADAIGRGLNVPVTSLSPEEAPAHFGWLSMFAGYDAPASGAWTQERLDWHPTGPGLIADLEQQQYEN